MIISKTPLRISFAGGGSDIFSFYKKYAGAVVSVTIDKYIYITVNEKFDDDIRISYSKTENVKKVCQIKHNIVREALKKAQINGGIEITSIADIPSRGTGLGSSSSFTVGLMNVLHAYKKEFSTPKTLAQEACDIEINILKEPIGKQDQYAAAYGGLNFIQFNRDGSVNIEPIICSKTTRQNLEKNLLVFYTGISRSASNILTQQKSNITKKIKNMGKMVQLAYELKNNMQKNDLDSFGRILHENWLLKKEMTNNISTPLIDKWYDIGRQNGALGGKILGAGGGGFLMFYAPLKKHQQIKKALPMLKTFNCKFDYQGSKIIFIH